MFYAFIYFFGQRNPESCLNPYSLIDSLVDRGSYRCSNDKKPLFTGELCAIVQTNYNNTFFHGFMVRFLNFLKIFLGNIIFSFTPLVTFYYILRGKCGTKSFTGGVTVVLYRLYCSCSLCGVTSTLQGCGP